MMLLVLDMHRAELADEFGVVLRGDVHALQLAAMPEVLPGYCPCLDELPEFLMRVAVDIPWPEPAAKAVCMCEVRTRPRSAAKGCLHVRALALRAAHSRALTSTAYTASTHMAGPRMEALVRLPARSV
jgi:hypothetical protein